MLHTRVFDFRPWNGRFLEPLIPPVLTDDFPDVPALPETLLLMELKAYEPSVSLSEIAQLVRGDLGATLQIMRRAARECEPERLPARIEDCIAGLGLQACLEAAAGNSGTGSRCSGAVIELWSHSREVAAACSLLAEASGGAVHTEEAYLAGLFHGLDLVPAILGWNWNEPVTRNKAGAGWTLAHSWRLPACVQDYFRKADRPGGATPWGDLVRAAHLQVRRSPVCSACSGSILPQLQHKAWAAPRELY